MVTDQNPADEDVAAYLRASTDKQDDDHQRDDIHEWADRHGINPKGITEYVDLAQSGSDEEREQFNELISDIEEGEYDRVIVWEISRLARLGSIYQTFFEVAADHRVTINITNGWTDTVRPDGTGKLIADISAAVAEEERRKLISRVESGFRRAKSQGKWLGEVPVGFERTGDGYLRPNLNPGDGEDGYLEIRAALQDIESGESYNAVAKSLNTPGRHSRRSTRMRSVARGISTRKRPVTIGLRRHCRTSSTDSGEPLSSTRSLLPAMTDDELERRRRAAQEELQRMFETIDKDYDAHTDIESPVEDVNEDNLAAELDELEAELEDEMTGDNE